MTHVLQLTIIAPNASHDGRTYEVETQYNPHTETFFTRAWRRLTPLTLNGVPFKRDGASVHVAYTTGMLEAADAHKQATASLTL